MGKSTISMAIFNSYVCLPEGISTDFRLKLVGGTAKHGIQMDFG
jgi:hypothetical protein